MSALPHSSWVDRSDNQESLCCRVGGSGRKHAVALYGILAVSPSSRNSPDPKTAIARRDHEEVSQGCVQTHLPGLGRAPTRYTAVVEPTSLRTASLLPVAVTQRPQLLPPSMQLRNTN
jgi:hypothetical protein